MGESRISISLVLTTLGALIVIIALAVVGWIFVGDLNDRTQANNDVEVLDAAVAVSRYSSSLIATGAVQSNATMTRESVIAARGSIAADKAELSTNLALLEGQGYESRVARISQQAGQLISTVDEIENARPNLLRALLAGEQNWQKLATTTNRELVPALASSLDNQYYFMMTDRSELRPTVATGAEAFNREEFEIYTHIDTLLRSVAIGHSSLLAASRMNDPAIVTNVEEAFDSSAQRAAKSIEFLAENGGYELHPDVVPLSTALFNAGTGQGGYFDVLKIRLSMAVRERELIAEAHDTLTVLQAELDGLVDDVQNASTAAKDDSAQAASAGRIIMLVIGIVGVVLTLATAGFFVLRARRA